MAGVDGAVTRRTIALQKLCDLTGGKPFSIKPEGHRANSILWEAYLFEFLADSLEPIIQRLDKLESGSKKA